MENWLDRQRQIIAKMKPLVSIVITTYNYAPYLPMAIDSVLNQTYNNLEIIVVNDGSTDNTDEVIGPYLKDNRIKYIKQKNAGQAVAKNCGIKNSKGEYIAFLDADDYWMPEKLEKQLSLFASDSELGVVFSRAKWVGPDHKSRKPYAPKPHKGWVVNYLIVDNFVPFSSSVVKRICFDKVGFFDESLGMSIDWDLWLKMSVFYKFDFVNQELFVYRVGHPNQMSSKQEERREKANYIRARFVKNNVNMVSSKALKKAMAFIYRNRGDYYQNIDKKKSMEYNLKSLVLYPFQPVVYLRIIKLLII